MTKKLLLGALITTPLIVTNGVLAIYLQGGIGIGETIRVGLIISIYIFFIWLINISLVSKLGVSKRWLLYLLSFLLIALIGQPFRWLVVSTISEPLNFPGIPLFPVLNALIVNSIVWVIIELVRSVEQKKQAEATIHKLKIENLEAQKQSLIRQIQPHFLFNALSTLKSLIAENQKDAEAYTVKLSSFLRYSFTSASEDLTTLEKELEYVQNYIDLQSIRFEGAFTHEVDIPEDVLRYKLPVLALQTLVENIFKHNYLSEKKPLQFNISYVSGRLTVWNEKVGFKLTDRNETGLLNLKKRYELVDGSEISIMDREDSFAVTIPLIAP